MRAPAEHFDVVISSRVRLARNVDGYLFPNRISPEARRTLELQLREWLSELDFGEPLRYFNLKDLDPVQCQMLCERYLISRELAQMDDDRGVSFSNSERISIMTNEEDHLRIQVLRGGCAIEETLDAAIDLDRRIESKVPYAFHETFGYLTSCPTNAGTGLRISVMMHVPGIAMTGQIDSIARAAGKIGLTVRGFSGEGTGALGDLIQISNQQTLGRNETSIRQTVERLVEKIIDFERGVRSKLLEEGRLALEDRVWRALGTLRYARVVSSEEALRHLSSVRLGAVLKFLPDISVGDVSELIITTQPGHLQALKAKPLSREERDQVRANLLRYRFQPPSP